MRLAGEINNSLAALNGTYGTDVANSSDHCRSGKSARRSGLGGLSAPSSWCRAEGQKVPTVVPYDRDKVSLLPEGVSLVNLESTLGDYARDVKLACFHSGTTPCLTVRRRSSRSRHGFLRDLAQRDSYWSEPPLSDRPRYLRFLCARRVTISGWCGTAATQTQTLATLLRPPWTLEGLNMYKTSLLELVCGSLKGCRDFLFSIFVSCQIGCATASASTCASPLKSTSLLTVPSFTELPPGGHAPWLVRFGGRGPSGPLK